MKSIADAVLEQRVDITPYHQRLLWTYRGALGLLTVGATYSAITHFPAQPLGAGLGVLVAALSVFVAFWMGSSPDRTSRSGRLMYGGLLVGVLIYIPWKFWDIQGKADSLDQIHQVEGLFVWLVWLVLLALVAFRPAVAWRAALATWTLFVLASAVGAGIAYMNAPGMPVWHRPTLIFFGGGLVLLAFLRLVVHLFEDYAQKVRESAASEYVAGVVAAADDAIIGTNLEGQITSWNAAATRLFGFDQRDATGRALAELIPGSDPDDLPRFFARVREGDAVARWETEQRRKDGSAVEVSMSVSLLRDSERAAAGFACVARDITERRILERELVERNEELARSNEELATFAYVASHDLKAPLRAIDSLAGFITEDLDDSVDEDTKHHLALLQGRVARMRRLIDDMLAYSKAGQVDPAARAVRTDPREMVQGIIDLLAPPENFEVVIETRLQEIEVIRSPLEQVIRNLIDNALKHHDKPTGTIDVRILATRNSYVFVVQDDGPGIPREYHTRVFEMFQKLKPKDEVEGSGVGLAVVRRIVENHGGSLQLESFRGRGTMIRIQWPRPQSVPAAVDGRPTVLPPA